MYNRQTIFSFIITSALVLLFLTAEAQQNAIGFRLGDPSGLTFKHYMGKNALEINLGRTHVFSGYGWYSRRFDYWFDKQNFGYQEWKLDSYRATAPISLQVHYLFRNGIDKLADEKTPGLEWYYGFGGQLRHQSYRYAYRYKVKGDPNWYYADAGRVSDFDLGLDGVIGLEYRFKDAPFSVFADLNLFMEVINNPFLFNFQGGIGGRFHF